MGVILLGDEEKPDYGWACDFTCPTHGPLSGLDVEEMQREGSRVFIHRGCGDVCSEDWLF